MKSKFSASWKASSQPRKQRKFRANAPLHLKKKFVGVNLSKELRKKVGKRNIPVKKEDKVKVLRGKFKGKTGKVLEVKLKISKIIVEGMQANKMDGSKANVKMQPSNLQIIEMAERGKMQGTKSPTSNEDKTKEAKKETPKKAEKSEIKDKKENKK